MLVRIELAALHQLSISGKQIIRLGAFQFVLRKYSGNTENMMATYLIVNGHFEHLDSTCRIMRLTYQQSISYIIEKANESSSLLCLTFPRDVDNGYLVNFEAYAQYPLLST